jgi:hypothetical protein
MSSASQKTRDCLRAASPSAKPAAVARWASLAAAISCSAPRARPPPSAVSMTEGQAAGFGFDPGRLFQRPQALTQLLDHGVTIWRYE